MRFATTRAIGGTFDFAHIVPGDYFIAAVDEETMGDCPDAAFLDRLASGARRVSLTTGAVVQMVLERHD